MKFDIELVGKIGSMALINKKDGDIDYNKFARIGRELHPGIIWVSSGAVEIGRLDYIKRNGRELEGPREEIQTDYSAQGQTILMQTYRNYIDQRYNVLQVLVEHQHFNEPQKREHIRNLLLRAPAQNSIPIINYNDTVSFEENRKLEISALRKNGSKYVAELVDNDETAGLVACLVKAKTLLIFTGVDGIYSNINDKSTLITEISGANVDEVIQNIDECKKLCVGASRAGAGGAAAKLEYIKEPVRQGTTIYIANASYKISEVLSGAVPSTKIGVR